MGMMAGSVELCGGDRTCRGFGGLQRARVAAMDVARASAAIGIPSGGYPWPGLDDQLIGQDHGADDPYADEVRK